MSVYTAYEMVADCRAGRARGWLWFARNFVPPLRALMEHYAGADADARMPALLGALRSDPPKMDAAPVREMIVAMRPLILEAAGVPAPDAQARIPFESLVEALEPLTLVERQIVWLDTMGYGDAAAARLMRMSSETATSVRAKAAELLRGKLDHWTITSLRESGAALGEEARAAAPAEPVPARDYVEILDGRVTWQRKTEIERDLAASWFEIDHFCRVREADDAACLQRPFTHAEAAPYYSLLGVVPPSRALWKRLFS